MNTIFTTPETTDIRSVGNHTDNSCQPAQTAIKTREINTANVTVPSPYSLLKDQETTFEIVPLLAEGSPQSDIQMLVPATIYSTQDIRSH